MNQSFSPVRPLSLPYPVRNQIKIHIEPSHFTFIQGKPEMTPHIKKIMRRKTMYPAQNILIKRG
jgi:hypothetical protein